MTEHGSHAWAEGLEALTEPEDLRQILGPVMRRAQIRVRPQLHTVDKDWIAASRFCFVATADARGRCDVSPKGDPAGFVRVLDEKHLAIPERPGNRRGDGFYNVLSNPHAGLIFLIPGRDDTLRVNGRAQIVKKAGFMRSMSVAGHQPKLALLVTVEQVFYHCAKAFMRSEIWSPSSWNPNSVPSRAHLVKAAEDPDTPLTELEAFYGPEYAGRLYVDNPEHEQDQAQGDSNAPEASGQTR